MAGASARRRPGIDACGTGGGVADSRPSTLTAPDRGGERLGLDHAGGLELFEKFILFCAVATATALISRRFGFRPVIGFFLFGILLGPFGLGALESDIGFLSIFTISDTEAMLAIAELGVVFLLFSIGLELSTKRLLAMRRLIVGLGTAQIATAAVAVAGLAIAVGTAAFPALVIGLAFALSSTAIVMPALLASGDFTRRYGRGAFAVLLAQDIAVAPILLLVAASSAAAGAGAELGLGDALAGIGKAVGVVAAIVLAGLFVTRVVFETVAGPHQREMFLAFSLLIVGGSAWATASVGLSAALGAFIAGLILAETEFRNQLDIELEPLKDLLLGLFFFGIGLSIDLRAVIGDVGPILGTVAGLFVLKGILVFAVARVFGFTLRQSILLAGALAGAGEFVFVILGAARAEGLVSAGTLQFAASVAGLSMILTPAAMAASVRLSGRFREEPDEGRDAEPGAADYSGHVLIVGFGRVGRTVAHFLDTFDVDYIAVDRSPANVGRWRREGFHVFVGDGSRPEMLAKLGAASANAFVVTVDDPEAAEKVVRALRIFKPGAAILSRSMDPPGIEQLMAAGATKVVPDTVESSMQLAAAVCQSLHIPQEATLAVIEVLRSGDYRALK